MMRNLFLFALCIFFPYQVIAANSQDGKDDGYKVFDNGGEIPYRIPAIATTKKGTLVAVADYRYCKSDIGYGRIDLHVRTSSDGGRSWNKEINPPCMEGDGNMTDGNQKAGYGDPCIVADRKSGRIMLTSCSGFPGFFSGSREQHQGWARWYSDDEGKTWTGPEYIDEEYIYAPFDKSKYGAIKGWFVGSGKIHQSRYVKVKKYYRLYCAGSSWNGKQTANWVLYSDDFGMTWSFLGGCDESPVPGGDEPKVEELPNGNMVISSRNRSGRKFNIFTFTNKKKAQGSWADAPAQSSKENNGIYCNNACNGEIQMVQAIRKSDGKRTWLALQSLPISGRTNVSIFYKDLEDAQSYATPENIAKDWTFGMQVSHSTSAYSTLSMLPDNTIAFLYEENESNSGYDIVYKNISIEEATGGKYLRLK